jgi:hypothetical protein
MMLLLETWSKCNSYSDQTLLVDTVENCVIMGVFGSLESRPDASS